MPIAFAAQADTGRLRDSMQDSVHADALPGGAVLLVVADGMGGAPAGDVASSLATEATVAHLSDAANADSLDGPAIVAAANEVVWLAALADPAKAGMGTTLVFAVVGDDRARIANVGDSRAYLFRDGELRQLTVDHSYVAEAVRADRMTEDEARVHPYRNVITRVVGTQAQVEPDLIDVDLRPGDTVLLCSDGLHGAVDDDGVAAILAAQTDPARAAADLIAAANEAGGPDNIAVALASLGEPA